MSNDNSTCHRTSGVYAREYVRQFNKDEQNLLMYLETCIIDHFGKVAGAHMNEEDFDIAKRWNDEGFISFGRISFHDINKNTLYPTTHQVKFSDEAWKLAHQFRRERGERHVETINAKTKEIKNNT